MIDAGDLSNRTVRGEAEFQAALCRQKNKPEAGAEHAEADPLASRIAAARAVTPTDERRQASVAGHCAHCFDVGRESAFRAVEAPAS